ncbi:MAG: hypothetical protein IJL00_03850, partial [Clostridia bacterium]|nr:hypothetical protein [Clostridia bacterium]
AHQVIIAPTPFASASGFSAVFCFSSSQFLWDKNAPLFVIAMTVHFLRQHCRKRHDTERMGSHARPYE